MNSKTHISFGNETIDKFLDGGMLRSTFNLIERNGRNSRILTNVFYGSLATKTVLSGGEVIFLECNPVEPQNSKFFPKLKRVSLNRLGINKRDTTTKIKIAWRYTEQVGSPQLRSDMEQIDLLHTENNIDKEKSGLFIRVDDLNIKDLLENLKKALNSISPTKQPVIIIVRNLMHPFSMFYENPNRIMEFFYTLRCLARTMKDGAIVIDYESEMFPDYGNLKNLIYNICDSIISCYGYEDGEDILSGYKGIAGTINYIKIPKIDSFGFSCQRELSDWGYRFTPESRHFVIEQLNLPCDDEERPKLKIIDAS